MSKDKVESRTEQIRKLVVEYLEGMRLFSGENSDIPMKEMNCALDIAISELCLPNDPNAQGTRGLLKQLDEFLAARPSVPAQGQELLNKIAEVWLGQELFKWSDTETLTQIKQVVMEAQTAALAASRSPSLTDEKEADEIMALIDRASRSEAQPPQDEEKK